MKGKQRGPSKVFIILSAVAQPLISPVSKVMTVEGLVDIIRSGRAAVLLGAGISRQAGVPMVEEIIPEVLDCLNIPEAEAKKFIETALPFEASMQALLSLENSEGLFDLFIGDSPGRNHLLITRIAKSGLVPLVLTTNFDTLTETAAKSIDCDLELCYDGDDPGLFPSKGSLPRLVKLHGCITRRGALGATISAVANERSVAVRRNTLSHFLGAGSIEHLIILGYSFSDKFDISPAFAGLRLPLKYWIIEHSKDSECSIVPLSSLKLGHALRDSDGAVIHMNTDDFVRHVWEATQPDVPPEVSYSHTSAKMKLRQWRSVLEAHHGPGAMDLLAASLLKTANLCSESNGHAKRALGILDPHIQTRLAASAHQIMGDNFRDLQLPEEAPRHLRAALILAHRLDRADLKARALNSLGILLEDSAKMMDSAGESDTPHPPRRIALKYYDIAKRWAEDARDEELAAKCEGNIGIAMKNVTAPNFRRAAFSRLHSALRIARRVGDQRSVARYYGMMASCISLLGKKRVGISLWNRALQVSTDMGDKRHIAIWTANLGEDLIDIDPKKAAENLRSAVSMFTELRNPGHVRYCENLLAKIPTA